MNKIKKIRNKLSIKNFFLYLYVFFFVKILKKLNQTDNKDILLDSIDFIFKDRFKIKNRLIKNAIFILLSLMLMIFFIKILGFHQGGRITIIVKDPYFYDDIIVSYMSLFSFININGIPYIITLFNSNLDLNYVYSPLVCFTITMAYMNKFILNKSIYLKNGFFLNKKKGNYLARHYARNEKLYFLIFIFTSNLVYFIILKFSFDENKNIVYSSLLIYISLWLVSIYFYIIINCLLEFFLFIIVLNILICIEHYCSNISLFNFLNNFYNKEPEILDFMYIIFIVSIFANCMIKIIPRTWYLLAITTLIVFMQNKNLPILVNENKMLNVFNFISFVLIFFDFFKNRNLKYINDYYLNIKNKTKSFLFIKNNDDVLKIIITCLKYIISIISLIIVISTVYPGVNKIFAPQINNSIKNNLYIIEKFNK